MPTPSIITLLTADHREVAKKFETLEKTTARSAKKRLAVFSELDHALSVHADFEENAVYPILETDQKGRPLALEAVEEHGQIKRLQAELRHLDPAEDRWMAKLTLLMEDVRHHVKEEEGEVFPRLRSAVPAAELGRLAEEYKSAKAQALQIAGMAAD